MVELDPRLDDLAQAATVRVRHVDDDAAPHWGSGFFVAPGRVLTCAHVLLPYLRRDRGTVFAVAGEDVNDGIPVPAVLDEWLVADVRATKVPAEEDLALIRLLDDSVEHECVWLTDRAVRHTGRVFAYGYRPEPPDSRTSRPVPWSADATTNVRDDQYGLRFKPDAEFPKGVSGGPLVDPATGAVVGLIKARRRETDGGKAVAVLALRQFGDRYRRLLDEHDRWHARPPGAGGAAGAGETWTAAQQRLATAGQVPSADAWLPRDRRQALRLLSALPAPGAARPVAQLVAEARQDGRPGRQPDLVSWRDGHGRLYDGARPLDALVFLRFLKLVAEYVRAYLVSAAPEEADRGSGRAAHAAEALLDWVHERAAEDGRLALRSIMVTRAALPEGLFPAPARAGGAVPYPRPGAGTTVTVILDPVIEARPVRFFWQIWVDHGDGAPRMVAERFTGEGLLPRDLVPALRGPLSRAIGDHDDTGRPVPIEVALPVDHFDTPAHRWQIRDIGRLYDIAHLGAHSPVVLRDLNRRGERPDEAWRERWQGTAQAPRLTARRIPEPGRTPKVPQFAAIPHEAVPVMCRSAGRGLGRTAMSLALRAGHGIALWHTEGHASSNCQDACDDLEKNAAELLGRAGAAAELPDLLRQLRRAISLGRTEPRWAEPVALLYDDPGRPLPPEDTASLDSPC